MAPEADAQANDDSGKELAVSAGQSIKPVRSQANAKENDSVSASSGMSRKGSERGTKADTAKATMGDGAIDSLKADHRKAEQLFARFEKADNQEKQALIEQVCKALTLHTMLEGG